MSSRAGDEMDDHSAGHGKGHCQEAIAELYTFLDGELTEERRQVIQEHLDDCNPCLEAFDFEAELRIVIQHRCRESVPDDLRQRIASALTDPGVLDQMADPTAPGLAGADS
ncbi:MAG: mycothiol system anti-sigma-R factor [Acidimicrobiales bacterium]